MNKKLKKDLSSRIEPVPGSQPFPLGHRALRVTTKLYLYVRKSIVVESNILELY